MPIDRRVQELVDQIVEFGCSAEAACSGCPELLPKVRRALIGLKRMEQRVSALFPPSSADSTGTLPVRAVSTVDLPKILGYDVQEVLGRGGIGIVYKAWHLRLNRPVAIKMLLSGGYAGPHELERFHREAEAIAALHHPNIVQVYDSGEHDGTAYFTMEFVEGGNLARKLAGVPQPPRQAARILITLANAIQAAHAEGIIHRDLKPANVLLTAEATPKLSDFGLAHRMTGDTRLTLAGASLGTPSYMAPEQARGDKAAIGPATDIYALGAILYEMLTGRPPFRGETSAATLQQLMSDEPVPPARLNPRVPRDLQTVCLKCLAKEPSRRYASAAELADDLGRFDRGEPTLARPPGRAERFCMWARRRPTDAALYATLTAAALLLLALVGVELHVSGHRQAVVRAAEQDLDEADLHLQQSDLAGARSALERARGRAGTDAPPLLQQRVAEESQLQDLLQELDAIRLNRAMASDGHFRRRESDQEYQHAFEAAGFELFKQSPSDVAGRINRSPARSELIAALDDWSLCSAQDESRRTALMAIARLADPDPWRDRVRDPLKFWDGAHIKALARSAPLHGASPQLLVGLGERLMHVDQSAAVPYLRRLQQQYPKDFYANFSLGRALNPDPMAMGYFQAAVAIRPDAAAPLGYIGVLLSDQGHSREALPYLERSLQLDPQPYLRANLASALRAVGRTDDAIADFQQALRLGYTSSALHNELGMALLAKGRLNEAVEQFEDAIQEDRQNTWARYNLAEAMCKLGRPSQAIDQLHELLAINPEDEPTQYRLAQLLLDQGRLEDARAAWQKAVDLHPDDHAHWFGYAELSLYLGHADEYRRNRVNLQGHFAESTDPKVCERTAKACLLLPWDTDELRLTSAMADRAAAAQRTADGKTYPYDAFAQGLAAYRLGHFDQAISLMTGQAASVTPPCPKLITAMALFRKGEVEKARSILNEAVGSFDWTKQVDPNLREEFWVARTLRREAEGLIGTSATALSEPAASKSSPAGQSAGER
jgi:serine/threonine-protein kinase